MLFEKCKKDKAYLHHDSQFYLLDILIQNLKSILEQVYYHYLKMFYTNYHNSYKFYYNIFLHYQNFHYYLVHIL